MATITEVTARSIADSLRWVPFAIDEVFLCGGGARNPTLRGRLAAMLEPRPSVGAPMEGMEDVMQAKLTHSSALLEAA